MARIANPLIRGFESHHVLQIVSEVCMDTKVPVVGASEVAGLEAAIKVVRNHNDRVFLQFLLNKAKKQLPQ